MRTERLVFIAVWLSCLLAPTNTVLSAERFNQPHHPTVDESVAGGVRHSERSFGYTSQDPETAYSLSMHHSAGIIVLVLGAFVLASRLVQSPMPIFRIAMGATWILFGLFIFVNSDPEGWPIGPASLIESFAMPTTSEWLQHKALSFVPMVFGLSSFWGRSNRLNAWWTCAAVGLAVIASLGLMLHQHNDHPGVDIVNVQHWLFACTVLLIATSLLLEMSQRWRWPYKSLLMPYALMLLGLQLVLYVE